MNYRFVCGAMFTAVVAIGFGSVAIAQVPVTPNTSPPPLQNVQVTTIDASVGTLGDPHVDGALVAYPADANDGTGAHLRYFTLGVDTAPHQVPFGPGTQDVLPKVSGTRIAYS